MPQLSRRGFIAAGTATLGALAGCTSSGSSDGMELSTLSVGGSPGGPIQVQPTGEVVLLDFFATWCAPCKPQMESLGAIHSSFPDVHMLSITWESETAAIKEFWRTYDGTWPVASDPEVKTGQQYGVERIPTLIVFDPSGEEVWRHTGLAARDDIATQLEAAKQ